MLSNEKDFLLKIVDLGSLNYPLSKCLNILDLEGEDAAEFTKQFNDKNASIYQAYQKGVDKADFDIDSKLLLLAKAGDLNALKIFEKRSLQQKLKSRK